MVTAVGVRVRDCEAGMAEEFRDGDDVRAAAEELGGEGVPQHMGAERGVRVVAEPGRHAEVVDDGAGRPVGEPAAAAVEQQGR
jgi:hypothetical protein